jgi:hypothetical protein
MTDTDLIEELRYLLKREEVKVDIYRSAISSPWMQTADADAAVEHALKQVRR